MKKHFLTLLLACVTILAQAVDYKKPDFAFPKKVMADAELRYQEAVKNNDGEELVDALIRWGLAKSYISRDYIDTILARIDTVRAHETRPDIRCLLNVLQIRIQEDTGGKKNYQLDYSQVDSLWQYPLKNYKHLISANEMGLKAFPTLADFLWAQDTNHKPLRTSDKELLPYLYQQKLNRKRNSELLTLYAKYQDQVESGEILANTNTIPSDSLLTLYEAYLKKFPKSPWKNNIYNKISEIQEKTIHISFRKQAHSGDSICVCFSDVANLKEFKLNVLQWNGRYKDECDEEISSKDVKKIKTYTVSLPCDSMKLAPLPYGRYFLQLEYKDSFGKKVQEGIENISLLTISDATRWVIVQKDSIRKYWIDIDDGHPMDRLADGDLYPDTCEFWKYRPGTDVLKSSAEIFTDLNIYRPGETVHFTTVCYRYGLHERKLLSDHSVRIELKDANGKFIGSLDLKTDSMGQCQGEFVLPKDRMNGTFKLVVYDKSHQTLGNQWFSVSEYKLPHFRVEMKTDKPRYKKNDTILVSGHVENYSGVIMSGYPVKMTEPVDTVLTTDTEGNFTFRSLMSDAWRQTFSVSVTDDAGETQETSCFCYRSWSNGEEDEDDKNPKEEPTIKVQNLGIDDNHCAQIEVYVPWESYIYYIASARDSILSQGWLHYDKAGKYTFQQWIPTQMDEAVTVEFRTMHQSELTRKSITVRDTLLQHKVHLTMDSFRDKLFPGGKEQWTFHLSDAQGKSVQGRMLIEMYQQALEEMASNVWNWKVRYYSRNQSQFFANYLHYRQNYSSWQRPSKKELSLSNPRLDCYGQNFFSQDDQLEEVVMVGFGGSRNRLSKSNNVEQLNVVDDDVEIEEAEMGKLVGRIGGLSDAPDADAFASIPVRQMVTKVALWQPMLTADANGNISITVDMPEDNTTWRMQALAFSQQLATDTLSRQIIAQRPVMVQPSLPRFLRQGDQTELMGMVQNTQSQTVTADVLLELFDPRTGKVLASQTKQLTLTANSQQAVGITCTREISLQTLPYIGFRIKAMAEGCSDGEQQMLPLLEAVQPVLETTPFYLEPGEKDLKVSIPHSSLLIPNSSQVSLEICSNPTWYAIQALPTVCQGTGCTAPTLAHQLYGLTLAEGIAHAQVKGMDAELAGKISTAIQQWGKDKDSVLISPLMKNADLKIGTLIASPWINEAERQTWRMQALQKLFDAKQNADTKDEIFKKLSALQNSDGGLSWFDYPKRTSSLYATGETLELLGELHHLGLSANWVGEDRALAYYDSMQIVRLNEVKKSFKKVDYSQWGDYLYVRSLFDQPLPKKNQELLDKALEANEKEWREWSLPMRAYIALALHRNGHSQEAQTIVESLKEYTYQDGSRGSYWDNIPWMWCCPGKLSANALLLQTLHEITPNSKDEDAVRRYLLLNKQNNDWGNASLAAQVIYSLLSTGNNWLAGSDLTYTRRALTDKEMASGRLTIKSQPGNPVWGAVYVQRMAKMDSIEAYNIENLKVQKEILGADSIGAKATIRITIDNRIDMQYVTVKDTRPACLEPADRFSGYQWRLGAYRETKDAETNFFIQFLPKGHHVLTYEAYVTQAGTFLSGTTAVQCQYNAAMNAHSSSKQIVIK